MAKVPSLSLCAETLVCMHKCDAVDSDVCLRCVPLLETCKVHPRSLGMVWSYLKWALTQFHKLPSNEL